MNAFERRAGRGAQVVELDEPIELVDIDTLAPRFAEALRQASERRLLTLYDTVADGLSKSFPALAEAGKDQLDVLIRVAELVGLGGLDLDEPLADPDDEALAQRIAWREPASWATLSLLWAVTESAPATIGTFDWAQAAYAGKKPRGGSSLPEDDEQQALLFAAEALAGSPALTAGCALVVRKAAYLLAAADGRVCAQALSPIALVQSRGDTGGAEIELEAEDRVWVAEGERGFTPHGDREEFEGVLRMSSAGGLSLQSDTHTVEVVPGLTLLFEGDARE
jgi:hypothetical protein